MSCKQIKCYQGRIQDFLKGGSIIDLQAKKGGPVLGPMLKSLHRGPKGGGGCGPPGPPPPSPLDPPMVINMSSQLTVDYT